MLACPDLPRLRAVVSTLLFLAVCCTLTRADVGDFSPCLHFFYMAWPPKGLQGTPICQRWANVYRFASLYNRHWRSPWLSAYTFSRPEGKRPTTHWKFEPQLANAKAGGEMLPFPVGKIDQNVVDSQAVPLDYINSSYTRGHLNPSAHHGDAQDRIATFTLTNTVPQAAASNDGPWEKLEQRVGTLLGSHCLGEAYVVTGALPYRTERWLKDRRVAIPEYLWSAYCCPRYNRSLPAGLAPAFPAYAAIGRNDPDSTEEIVPVDRSQPEAERGYDVRPMALETLEGYLRDRYGVAVSVFFQRCSEGDASLDWNNHVRIRILNP